MLTGIVNQILEASFIEKLSLISALIVIGPAAVLGLGKMCRWTASAVRWTNGMRKEFSAWEPVRKSERATNFCCVMMIICFLQFFAVLVGWALVLKAYGQDVHEIPLSAFFVSGGFGFLAVLFAHMMNKYNPNAEAKPDAYSPKAVRNLRWQIKCDCVTDENMKGEAPNDWYPHLSDDGRYHVCRRDHSSDRETLPLACPAGFRL